jgi:hypothetical protein
MKREGIRARAQTIGDIFELFFFFFFFFFFFLSRVPALL